MAGPTPWIIEKDGQDARRKAPATRRNRDAIAQVLREILPGTVRVLEIASGSGEHVVHFAGLFPHLSWQPSDTHPDALTSISGWTRTAGLRSEEHTSELQSLMRISYAVFCLKKKNNTNEDRATHTTTH